jgi:hypothetical protein
MKMRNPFAGLKDADLEAMKRLREDEFYRHLEFLREKFAHLLRSSQRRNENA